MITPINSQSSMIEMMNQMQRVASETEIEPSRIDSQNLGLTEDFQNVIQAVNHDQNVSSQMMQAVDTGKSDDVVGAMIASQKADLSFSMLVQVRNRVMEGFDDIMRMSL